MRSTHRSIQTEEEEEEFCCLHGTARHCVCFVFVCEYFIAERQTFRALAAICESASSLIVSIALILIRIRIRLPLLSSCACAPLRLVPLLPPPFFAAARSALRLRPFPAAPADFIPLQLRCAQQTMRTALTMRKPLDSLRRVASCG